MDPYSGMLEMLEAKDIVVKVGNKLSYVSPVTGEEPQRVPEKAGLMKTSTNYR